MAQPSLAPQPTSPSFRTLRVPAAGPALSVVPPAPPESGDRARPDPTAPVSPTAIGGTRDVRAAGLFQVAAGTAMAAELRRIHNAFEVYPFERIPTKQLVEIYQRLDPVAVGERYQQILLTEWRALEASLP